MYKAVLLLNVYPRKMKREERKGKVGIKAWKRVRRRRVNMSATPMPNKYFSYFYKCVINNEYFLIISYEQIICKKIYLFNVSRVNFENYQDQLIL